eukprot:scaffold28354_cov129-Isochrysis_galbana.AAC.1
MAVAATSVVILATAADHSPRSRCRSRIQRSPTQCRRARRGGWRCRRRGRHGAALEDVQADEVAKMRHAGVHAWILRERATVAPADHTREHVLALGAHCK